MPFLQTLVIGNLTVSNLVDLTNLHENGFDIGGTFIPLGNVICIAFAGEADKLAMVDADLIAREAILNDLEDSALVVAGNLRTRFFYGIDIWASVGGACFMASGYSYCRPLDGGGRANRLEPALDPVASMKSLHPSLDPKADGFFRHPARAHPSRPQHRPRLTPTGAPL